jgi:hypothetical protein
MVVQFTPESVIQAREAVIVSHFQAQIDQLRSKIERVWLEYCTERQRSETPQVTGEKWFIENARFILGFRTALRLWGFVPAGHYLTKECQVYFMQTDRPELVLELRHTEPWIRKQGSVYELAQALANATGLETQFYHFRSEPPAVFTPEPQLYRSNRITP